MKQDGTDGPCYDQGRGDSNGHAEQGHAQGCRDYDELDALAGCAEGHADTDLLGPAGDGIGDDSVDTEGGEQEAEDGEEAARRGGVVDDALHGFEFGERLAGIDLA